MKRKFFLIALFLSIFLFFSVSYTGLFVGEFGAEVDPGIIVVDHEFRDGVSSSDFLRMSDLELSNVDNLGLEVNGHGKIYFPGTVDLTVDEKDGFVYLDENVDMFHNFISINSSELKSLNRSAIVTFKDIELKDPVVARNGVICNEPQCRVISFVNKEFSFEVDSFSYYTLIENPNPEDSSSSSGGGASSSGGGGVDSVLNEDSFFVAPDFVGVRTFPGVGVEKELTIVNNGSRSTVVEISISDSLKRFLYLKNSTFVLDSENPYFYPLNFLPRENTKPGVYSGTIIVKTGDLVRTIDTLIEIKDPKRLFDIEVRVNDKVSPGEPIYAKISAQDLGSGISKNVKLYYSIRDFEDNTIVMREEVVNIERKGVFDRELRFPRIVSGKRYVFYVQIEYDDKVAFATDTFKVREAVGVSVTYIIISALILALIVWIAVRVLWQRKVEDVQLDSNLNAF